MRLKRVYGVALCLIIMHLFGCAGLQPSKIISERMFKESCQSATGCDLTKAPRLVVRSYCMGETFAVGVKGGSAAGDVAAGAAAGAAMGALQVAGAAAAVIPGGIAASLLVGAIVPGSRDQSSGFAKEVNRVLPPETRSEQASARVEKMLKSRTKSEILTQNYQLNRKGANLPQSQVQYQPNDAVLNLNYMLWFADKKPVMVVVLNWHLVADHAKEEQLSARMQAINWKDRKTAMAELNKIKAEYGGQGQFAYKSPPYSPQEWLADNGKRLNEEYDKALAELARRLEAALFLG